MNLNLKNKISDIAAISKLIRRTNDIINNCTLK